jgi:murein DD-endopeptidase MepM/ murein hydrolase activator NlpD
LQSGGVAVRAGDTVTLGAPIGHMGNSGQTGEPHLHIHAQRGLGADNPFEGEPLPLMIEGRYLVRNDRLHIESQTAE